MSMKFYKAGTSTADYLMSRYNESTATDIHQVFKKPSYQKEKAFNEIKQIMKRLNGFDMHVTSYTSFYFLCGFLFDDDDGIRKLLWYTPYSIYCVQA